MTELGILEAPWNDEQVRSINQYQNAGAFHPFTCGDTECRHAHHRDNLMAYDDGMHCKHCDYVQTWVFAEMADGSAIRAHELMMNNFKNT